VRILIILARGVEQHNGSNLGECRRQLESRKLGSNSTRQQTDPDRIRTNRSLIARYSSWIDQRFLCFAKMLFEAVFRCIQPVKTENDWSSFSIHILRRIGIRFTDCRGFAIQNLLSFEFSSRSSIFSTSRRDYSISKY
jgi:hypothetical protein